MAQMRFCSKCGASLPDGADHCQLCRAPASAALAGPAGGSERPAGSPWFSMWLHPRVTMRAILNHDPTYLVLPIAAVGGVSQALNRLADKNAGDKLSFPVLLLFAITLGPLGGILGLHITAALLRVTGRWIGGAASAEEIRASIAWGSIPAVWGALIWIPAIALTGKALFSSSPSMAGDGALLIAGVLLMIQFASIIWSFFTGLHALGEVQGFSAWRAFGNIILSGLIIFVPFMLAYAIFLVLGSGLRS
jgi:hypothetical protein